MSSWLERGFIYQPCSSTTQQADCGFTFPSRKPRNHAELHLLAARHLAFQVRGSKYSERARCRRGGPGCCGAPQRQPDETMDTTHNGDPEAMLNRSAAFCGLAAAVAAAAAAAILVVVVLPVAARSNNQNGYKRQHGGANLIELI